MGEKDNHVDLLAKKLAYAEEGRKNLGLFEGAKWAKRVLEKAGQEAVDYQANCKAEFYISEAYKEFIENDPKFCAALQLFNEQGEAGLEMLKKLMEMVNERYKLHEDRKDNRKPGFTIGEKVHNIKTEVKELFSKD